MAKEAINIFGVSFLDLLSGALAAVIILFVIVPKMDVEAKEASEKLDELGLEVAQLDDLMDELAKSIPADQFDAISKQLDKVQQQLQAAQQLTKKLEQKVEQLEEQVQQLEKQVEDLKRYKEWMDNCGFAITDACPAKPKPVPANVGFNFLGKNVVFLIDCSGSMLASNNDDKQNRLPAVKAGLKMLIATMADDFSIDIIRFPNQSQFDIGYNWGQLRSASESNKRDAYKYIYNLSAGGGTPTRKALEYALNNYPQLTDIVVLTDGQPTGEAGNEDISTLLSDVRRMNTKSIRINSVGIGKSFFNDPSNPTVQFLKDLAAQNGQGFFVDFY